MFDNGVKMNKRLETLFGPLKYIKVAFPEDIDYMRFPFNPRSMEIVVWPLTPLYMYISQNHTDIEKKFGLLKH